MPRQRKPILFCSFCRKGADAVDKLVAGPGVFICNACVAVCQDVIAQSPARTEAFDEIRAAALSQEAEAQLLKTWRGLDSETLLKGLATSESAVEASRQVLQSQIDILRERKVSWAQIGDALDMSRQAAWERFG